MAQFLVVLIAVFVGVLGLPQSFINEDLDWRIVGGSDAKVGQFPYQVSLRKGKNHFCGGSILSARWIITAAHCVAGSQASKINVVVGTTTLNTGGAKYTAAKIIIHKGWNPKKIVNDIALIQTAENIKFEQNVAAITAATENIGGGVDVILSGWGRTSYPGSIPNKLQFINLKTLTVSQCKSRLSNTYPTQVCTFTRKGQGACHGDSGGPLVNSGKLVGIVSWGRPCAVGYPDVFTRVSAFINWINSSAK